MKQLLYYGLKNMKLSENNLEIKKINVIISAHMLGP